jgi:flagellar basal-body rod protein FlgC
MDFMTAMKISTSGLKANRTRVNVATSNIANVNSTRGPDGEVYKKRNPVLETIPFQDEMNATWGEAKPYNGVRVAAVIEDEGPGRKVFDPSHPDADSEGFVTYPDIDPSHEVVNLMSASRSYEANATAIETLKGMAQRALEILR